MRQKAGPWQPLPYQASTTRWDRNSESHESHSPDPRPAIEHNDFLVRSSALLRILAGVAVAAKTKEADIEPIHRWFSTHGDGDTNSASSSSTGPNHVALSLKVWQNDIEFRFRGEAELHQLASMTLAVTFLHEKCRQDLDVARKELDDVWQLVKNCLVNIASKQLFSTSRSAQGFLSVPLCSLQKDGNIDELYRLHVWLPDDKRGNPDFAIHAHQCFAQSWVLAGDGKDNVYTVTPATGPAAATHAEYALAWSDAKGADVGTTYKTHQKFSVIRNTKRLVSATPKSSSIHSNGMSYTIPAAAFHTTTVAPGILHATLFVFDAHRGFEKNAGILGPKYKESFTQQRDPDIVLPTELAKKVDTVRKWENLIRRGRRLADDSDMEKALWAFDEALKSLEGCEHFLNVPLYRQQTQGNRANMYRRFGKYKQAEEILKSTIAEMDPSLERLELESDLAVLYSGTGQLDNCKRVCETQYDTATKLKADSVICRTIGALGMVNYQLYIRDGERRFLDDAITQLQERVELALKLRDEAAEIVDPVAKTSAIKYALTRASIGHARLALCHEARGDIEKATATSLESLKMAIQSGSSSVTAMSRYFYGRALLQAQRRDEALKQFNPPKTCTPAMALCMEPSHENRKYLEQLVEAGADMDLVDEHGYTALDYAVYNGNGGMEALLLEALRRKLGSSVFVESRISFLLREAKVRKGYRDIFQEQLRPLLLQARSRSDGLNKTVAGLRHAYALALSTGSETRLFDQLKYIRFTDFVALGRLPRSGDKSIIQEYEPRISRSPVVRHEDDFIIFMSYRWIHMDAITMIPSPDDPDRHTQYKRMVRAVDQLLLLQPSIDRDRVGIWVVSSSDPIHNSMSSKLTPGQDSACINQDDPAPGVSALPILLAQCNAVISLIDEEYHTRAWCSVEVAMVQQLRESYKLHLWYEQKDYESLSLEQSLIRGPDNLVINMAEKHLTYESDRPKVLFLERQSKLLGRELDLQY